MLEEADHQDALVTGDDVLGSVAMVHIKIHNRDAFESMALQRITRRNRHVVQKAEAHGFVTAGVVARRPH